MQTHVRVLAVLYLVGSGISLGLAALLLLVLGGTAGIVGAAADARDAAVAIPILGITGTAVGAVLVLFAVPGLLTGYGLLYYRPWARIAGIVLSALSLINFPIGTAIRAYGLWVLLSRDTEPLFAETTAAPSSSL